MVLLLGMVFLEEDRIGSHRSPAFREVSNARAARISHKAGAPARPNTGLLSPKSECSQGTLLLCSVGTNSSSFDLRVL